MKNKSEIKHVSHNISTEIGNFLPIQNVRTVWEVGSRDGQDGLALAEAFPQAEIISFEPNPDTFHLVKNSARQSRGRLQAFQYALSNETGSIAFHKIDVTRTITSWPDGNPGASSMFPASGNYEIEKYVQIPIKVEAVRAASLIEDGRTNLPEFLWMDVQGAELMVLEGFDKYLLEVECIYVELSLKTVYQGQALAFDVVNFLKNDFFWVRNFSLGEWQFDAFFVNRKNFKLRYWIKDYYFRNALKFGLGLGIRYKRFPIKRALKRFGKRGWETLLQLIAKTEVSILNYFGRVTVVMSGHLKLNPTFRFRQIISRIFLVNPLQSTFLPSIDVVIPCHQKDLRTLELVLDSVTKNIENPISKILLICPESIKVQVRADFPQCTVLSDEELVPVKQIAWIREYVSVGRQGWYLQQLAKIHAALSSTELASLILDADTLLLQRRTWLDNSQRQLLCISEEFHMPYKVHQSNFFKHRNVNFSFVTHHQLWQTDILHSIFDMNERSVDTWLMSADLQQVSSLSEYDTYGEYLYNFHHNRFVFGKWNNVSSSTLNLTMDLTSLVQNSNALSISFHSYLA